MVPSAEQAKLGVTAEESKAQRIQRQQARFRDRGGAFVPSNSNPLIDILLARTVTGESPSKARAPKDRSTAPLSKSRVTFERTRQESPTRKRSGVGNKNRAGDGDRSNPVAGSSKSVVHETKSKQPAPRKRKAKPVDSEDQVNTDTTPAPKRRGKTLKSKGKEADAEQAPKPKFKSKGKQQPASSTSKPKPKPKPKQKAVIPEKVVKVLSSDDDQTLVETPRKHKAATSRNRNGSTNKRKAKAILDSDDENETDDDTPIVTKRAKLGVGDVGDGSKADVKIAHAKAGKNGTGGKRLPEDLRTMGEREVASEHDTTHVRTVPVLAPSKHVPKTSTKRDAKKRPRPTCDDEDGEDPPTAPPPKKGKTAKSITAKPKDTITVAVESEPSPHTNKAKKTGDKGKNKGKAKVTFHPDSDVEEEKDAEEVPHPPPKAKKRKKLGSTSKDLGSDYGADPRENDNDRYDDRPKKAAKVSDEGPRHPSSEKLKENNATRVPPNKVRPNSKAKTGAKATAPSHSKEEQSRKSTSRSNPSKGPPRDVLERIRASAAQHRRHAEESEPDELDCLS
ncbi:hypothetical protein PAXINDRAFT_179466 [Paxillus involutus ATCC 200175]|nr:hypothetical protein PAXINDRAFT_179466 [Paxillus involutus ATCC 200175]